MSLSPCYLFRSCSVGLTWVILWAVGCANDSANSHEVANAGGSSAPSPSGGKASGVGGAASSTSAPTKVPSGGASGGSTADGSNITTSSGGTMASTPASSASSGAMGGVGATTEFTGQGGSSGNAPRSNGGAKSTLSTTTGGKSSGGSNVSAGAKASGGANPSGGASAHIAGGGATFTGSGGTSGRATGKGGAPATGGTPGALPAITVYLAGDSIVSSYTDTAATNDQAGWGQMLAPLFNSKVTFANRAAGGRTAYWFYLEGALDKILSTIKAGDYLLIEFGTNDQNTTATFDVNGTTYPRLAEPALFKTQLKQYYLDPVRAKGATPVLVTPPPRNSAYCNGGNGLSAYATAMVELGAAEAVVVIDNNAKTFAYVKAICPKPTTAANEQFFFGKPDGSIDGTHFQENGARTMASFIAEGVRTSELSLAGYLL